MPIFDSNCQRCSRLSEFLEAVKEDNPGYFCKPVPPFGEPDARLIVVGLAPGMHGANATGRPFTGDYAGILLYETLHKFGFGSAPKSISADDGLELINCRITNAVKCLPPANKPTGKEINECNAFLADELQHINDDHVIIALGTVAHQAVLKARGLKPTAYKFGHGAQHALPGGGILVDSYHCSRYNTQTRRLTTDMFEQIFAQARTLLAESNNT